ncbi:MAG: 3-deoxy-manno-octulosonate cytidylyltransferase [Bacteroidetes bacterium]|nr:3-deoxy-manno-octulosonate cytidylyltransferase [Bacteroidota bacterium]
MRNKVVALIPARYAATRLPGKLMMQLHGKSILLRTYEACKSSGLFDEVIAVCDDTILFDEIELHGGKAVMSKQQHESGTDRIAEIAVDIDADIFVNVQGDEPFISAIALQKVISLFNNPAVEVGSLKIQIDDVEKINNPNCVKVVCDKEGKALYFSRAAIPYYREQGTTQTAYQHIGVYAFRKETLLKITLLPISQLEHIEKLENLRLLENGISIHLAEISHVGISIDTAEDFAKANEFLNQSDSI